MKVGDLGHSSGMFLHVSSRLYTNYVVCDVVITVHLCIAEGYYYL